jgi:ubiquinone/menaquinone biosynthesis C-methylase UbiE
MQSSQDARASMFGLARHAHGYETFAGRLAGRMYRRVTTDLALAIAAEKVPANARILDVGTGPGLVPLRIADHCPQLRIDAVDLSPEMIARAQQAAIEAGRAAMITFAVADVADLPFPDGAFDLVISSISQHHWADPAAGMQQIARVLRPGADAWIYDFRWSLNRAETGANQVHPAPTVTRQSPLVGSSRFSPIGRLVITP